MVHHEHHIFIAFLELKMSREVLAVLKQLTALDVCVAYLLEEAIHFSLVSRIIVFEKRCIYLEDEYLLDISDAVNCFDPHENSQSRLRLGGFDTQNMLVEMAPSS